MNNNAIASASSGKYKERLMGKKQQLTSKSILRCIPNAVNVAHDDAAEVPEGALERNGYSALVVPYYVVLHPGRHTVNVG